MAGRRRLHPDRVWTLLASAGSSRAAESSGSAWVAEYNVAVRMSDGVELSTDVYRPAGERPVAAILVRTPYNNGGDPRVRERARAVVAAGLAFVQQDVRGRHDSGGQWVPFVNEGRDGHETIEWIARQPWSDGRVITEGGSYMAHVQWLAAAWRSPHLVAMMPRFSPLAIYEDGHRGGAFELTRIKWATLMDGRTQQTLEYDWPRDPAPPPRRGDGSRGPSPGSYPSGAESSVIPRRTPSGRPETRHAALERLEIPVLLAGGWYDPFLSSTLLGFTGTDGVWNATGPERARRLVIGPWRHGGNAQLEDRRRRLRAAGRGGPRRHEPAFRRAGAGRPERRRDGRTTPSCRRRCASSSWARTAGATSASGRSRARSRRPSTSRAAAAPTRSEAMVS